MDYNTQRAPAFYMEEVEHLPYHKERVAYFRWMYNKDPGHQYAKLGPLPPRPEVDPDCPCPKDVEGMKGIPGTTESLWRDGVPQPVDESVFAPPTPPPPTGFAPLPADAQPPRTTIPSVPVTAPTAPNGANSSAYAPRAPVQQQPAPVPPPKTLNTAPADPIVPPAYGPSAQPWGNFRVIGNQPAEVPNPGVPVVPPPASGGTIRQIDHRSTAGSGAWLLLR